MLWLYAKEITLHRNVHEYQLDEAEESILDLYIFADRYDIRLLRNNVMEAYVSLKDRIGVPDVTFIVRAFNNLPFNSTFCHFLGQYCGARWRPSEDSEEERQLWPSLPMVFIIRVMLAMSERPTIGHKRDRGSCEYHEHLNDKERDAWPKQLRRGRVG